MIAIIGEKGAQYIACMKLLEYIEQNNLKTIYKCRPKEMLDTKELINWIKEQI